jgi:transposase
MDARTAAPTLSETAVPTLFLALELSRSTWLIALHSPVADKVSQHRLEGGDADGLLALIGRKRRETEGKLGRPVRVVSCFEAGYDGFWLHRWLCARGIENRVLDAASLLVDRRARRAKTDRLDAAALLRALMALERGEALVCRVVQVPTAAQEDARRRSRERARLVVERGQHTSRIKGGVAGRFRRSTGPLERPRRAADDAGYPRVRAGQARLAGTPRGAARPRGPASRALSAGRIAARVPPAAAGDGDDR